jgi:hypothetical protein
MAMRATAGKRVVQPYHISNTGHYRI